MNTFISNLDAEDAKSLWAQLAKRLGPDGRKQGETNVEVRQGLATTIERLSVAMGGGEGSISSGSGSGVGQSTIDLNAFSKKRLGERDFSLILPVVNTLGTPEGWLAFVVNEGEITGLGVRVLLPLVFQGLHSIFDDDGVVNRGWFAGLKALVRAAGIQGGQDPSWHHLLETTVMPLLKSCLSTNLPSARKLFLLIIREAAIVFRELATTTPLLFGDLNCLVDEEDQEVSGERSEPRAKRAASHNLTHSIRFAGGFFPQLDPRASAPPIQGTYPAQDGAGICRGRVNRPRKLGERANAAGEPSAARDGEEQRNKRRTVGRVRNRGDFQTPDLGKIPRRAPLAAGPNSPMRPREG